MNKTLCFHTRVAAFFFSFFILLPSMILLNWKPVHWFTLGTSTQCYTISQSLFQNIICKCECFRNKSLKIQHFKREPISLEVAGCTTIAQLISASHIKISIRLLQSHITDLKAWSDSCLILTFRKELLQGQSYAGRAFTLPCHTPVQLMTKMSFIWFSTDLRLKICCYEVMSL